MKFGHWTFEIDLKFEIGNLEFRAVRGDGVLFVERANELVLCGLPKEFYSVGTVKARLNRPFVAWTKPEARRATYEQGEPRVKSGGGPHPLAVQH